MDQPVNSTRARIAALIAGMTLDEKLAQLVGVWVDAGAGPGARSRHCRTPWRARSTQACREH
jgi:hypothetical protein